MMNGIGFFLAAAGFCATAGVARGDDLLNPIALATPDETTPCNDVLRGSDPARIHEAEDIRGTILSLTVVDGVIHRNDALDSLNGKDAAGAIAQGEHGVESIVDHLPVAEVDTGRPAARR